jgi:uncharacterized protein YndB with AHSA1/START domain
MRTSDKLQVTTPSDVEIAMTRRFEAPPELVWDAFTRPELMKRWMYGPDEWPLEVCNVELRPGGAIRYEWHGPDGEVMGLNGEFRELEPPHRMVHTELFDEDWTGGETVVTTTFKRDGADATVVTMSIRYGSKEARDGALESAMAEGMGEAYSRLDGILVERAASR